MAGVITVGGLASGLDTNKIIDQLTALEHRPVDLLTAQLSGIQATKTSVSTFQSKLAALRTAAAALDGVDGVLVRNATSSDTSVLTAAAGAGAARGSTAITVTQLAHASVAGATVGVSSPTATIAAGAGTFQFQVGSGAVQTVNVDATTTLQGLADSINNLGAGVTASAVNLGTSASPDYRLELVTTKTGAASTLSVTHDGTTLGVQVSQTGQDAQFTVAGFAGTFSRDSNTFSDVLPGVTVTLTGEGTSTIGVNDDADGIVSQVKALVTAFNDAVTFVAGESTVQETASKDQVNVGSLATDTTVKGLLSSLHDVFSERVAGATSQYVNLSSLGLATQQDGTIQFDETKFRAALGADPEAVAQVFAGNGTAAGVASDLKDFVDRATGVGGPLAGHQTALDGQVRLLQDEIDRGERRVAAFTADLQRQFTALETLVSGLQSQSGFLLSALGNPTAGA